MGSQAPVEAPGEEGDRGGGESCSGCPLSPAVISLPSTYQELGCGLWGNFDKNQKNEFMLLSDALTQNLNNFSNSRKVKMKQGLSCFSRCESWGSEQEGPGLRATTNNSPVSVHTCSTPYPQQRRKPAGEHQTRLPDSSNSVGAPTFWIPVCALPSPCTPTQFFLSSWSSWVSPGPWLSLPQGHPRREGKRRVRMLPGAAGAHQQHPGM